jgi:hypothetical protein
VHAPKSSISSIRGRNISPTTSLNSMSELDDEYQESTRRRLEREEAQTMRHALQIIDQQDEEGRIYTAAQQEAADLVWKHQNPQAAETEKTAPYINPDVQRSKSYGAELGNGKQTSQRNASDSSHASSSSNGTRMSSRTSRDRDPALSHALRELQLASDERSAAIVATAKAERRRSSGLRNPSNGSNQTIFRNPADRIYEDVQSPAAVHATKPKQNTPLHSTERNSLPRGSRPLPEKPGVVSAGGRLRFNRIDIYKNEPSQSRNAAYTSNNSVVPEKPEEAPEPPAKTINGIEIRGDDIRAATSMRLKDRSAKLPTPVAVSDQVGRPIVSFDPAWKPHGDSPRGSQDVHRPVIKLTESPRASKEMERPQPKPLPPTNVAVHSAPVIPTINLPGDDDDIIPSIQVTGDVAPVQAPSISVFGPSIDVSAPEEPVARPKHSPRPLPKHATTSPAATPANRRLPWLKSGLRGSSSVACDSCGLAIAGRIVTASGSNTKSLKARFHPECFSCSHCQTNLECIAFFPEPDDRRQQRLDADGIEEGSPEADIRFYCSLDFSEMFAPRCKSCKTPIEGEVIVAAGAEWHVGHFFCAECGDPFDSNTPFVEKDGYAYCVRCHTKRTSARCRECKQQILDELTVEALGGKWHEKCFKCFECDGSFGDEGRFFIRDVSVEPTDKEKRKGITKKMEEKAVCQGCEERRLKA